MNDFLSSILITDNRPLEIPSHHLTFIHSFNYLGNYEYDKSKPCVLIKINKIYGWKPEPYRPNDPLPAELLSYETQVRTSLNNVFILCHGEFQVDIDFTGELTYYSLTPDGEGQPKIGFITFFYFPYKNQDG